MVWYFLGRKQLPDTDGNFICTVSEVFYEIQDFVLYIKFFSYSPYIVSIHR